MKGNGCPVTVADEKHLRDVGAGLGDGLAGGRGVPAEERVEDGRAVRLIWGGEGQRVSRAVLASEGRPLRPALMETV